MFRKIAIKAQTLWPIVNNLNVFFLISIRFTWWPIFGEMCPWINQGWAKFPSNYFVNEL